MSISGRKDCVKCAARLRALDVLRVSLGGREIPCHACGTPFEFSLTRKWVAILVVVAIVFAPAPAGLPDFPWSSGVVLLVRYAAALFLFVLINGREAD